MIDADEPIAAADLANLNQQLVGIGVESNQEVQDEVGPLDFG